MGSGTTRRVSQQGAVIQELYRRWTTKRGAEWDVVTERLKVKGLGRMDPS